MKLFDRKEEILINGKKYDSKYDITFKVPFSNDPEPDVSEISIYNLSEKSINEFNKKDELEFLAGYGTDIGTLVKGDIDNIEVNRSGVDKELRLFVSTGHTEVKETKIEKSFSAGMTNVAILNGLLGEFGLEIGSVKVGKTLTYKARSFSGLLIDVVLELIKESYAKFYIEKGKIYVVPLGEGNDIGFKLSADTGLIGSPEPIDIDSIDDKDKKLRGWKISSLLNYKIGIDSIIELDSKIVSGKFRVVSGEHSDHLTEMEVLEA